MVSILLRYRSRYEIVASILRACNAGVKKTKIMYGAALSYAQLKEYLPRLEKSGLIACDARSQLYFLTDKGMHFLNSFDEIDGLLIASQPFQVAEELRPIVK
ncbi:MAG: winged helix-turn-helix domain-containing protein [Nitrososphaerales archaeon]